MLVLSRKLNEEIVIDGDIRIRILDLGGHRIRIGIEAPRDMSIIRGELSHEPPVEAETGRSARKSSRFAEC